MFDKLKPLPNHIFVPKIVPLVYDDTLSYYEFICKLMVKLEEVINVLNDLGVRVDTLEEAVRQLQEIINTFDDRITACEGDIDDIKIDINTINGAITDINTAIEGINGAITNINTTVQGHTIAINTINNSINAIEEAIEGLSDITADVSQLQDDVESLDSRVTSLESATFGDISVSPTPKNLACNMMCRDTFDWEIIQDTEPASGFSEYQICVPDPSEQAQQGVWGFRFRGNNNYGHCRLIIKNFIPFLQDSEILTIMAKFNPAYSGLNYGQVVTTTFGDLKTGISCMVGGEDDLCIGGAKIVESTSNMGTYDLELTVYNPNVTYETIENSYYSLNYLAIVGGSGYTTGTGRIAVDEVEPFFNAYQFTKTGVSQSDFNSLADRVTTAENDIDTIQGNLSTFTYNEYVTDFNNLLGEVQTVEGNVNSIDTRVEKLEDGDTSTITVYTGFDGVFDLESLPEGVSVQYFRAYKQGAIRIIDGIFTNFVKNSNYSAFKLGTIKSNKVSEWAPYYPVNVSAVSLPTTNDVPPRIQVAGDTPKYVSGREVKTGIATLTGSDTTNPFNEGGQYHDTHLDANSLYVGINNNFNDYYNAIHFRMVYFAGV